VHGKHLDCHSLFERHILKYIITKKISQAKKLSQYQENGWSMIILY
jgi:hypothetical protein